MYRKLNSLINRNTCANYEPLLAVQPWFSVERGDTKLSSVSLSQIQKEVITKIASVGSHQNYVYVFEKVMLAIDQGPSLKNYRVERVVINLRYEKILLWAFIVK